jgi:ribose transport system substrate-binding protein
MIDGSIGWSKRIIRMSRQIVVAAVVALACVVGCNSNKDPAPAPSKTAPSFAFITNGVADFWTLAAAGATKAGEDLGVQVEIITPESITVQTRRIEDLLTRGIQGIAISPINSANQADILNKAAAQTNLITQDSDAPDTNRLVYIGMGNYEAGLLCGQTLRKAMPDGGKVMIFVGRSDQDNAVHRRRGFIDALLERKPDPNRNDPPGDEIKSEDGKFIVLGTMTDQFDRAKAKANVEDTVTAHPDIAAMVGLFGYNPPCIIEGLERTGKLGKVKVMGFDEDFATLQAVKDGNLVATIVQNPYQYGYQSIQTLNELHKGNKSVIPENKFVDIPARVIHQFNVDTFWQEIKERLGKK